MEDDEASRDNPIVPNARSLTPLLRAPIIPTSRHARVLLIQPPSTLQRLQRWKSRRPEMEPPLPFVCIGPYLLDAGFDVDVLDLRIEGIHALLRILRDTPPLIAGISVMPGSMLLDAIRITRLIKEAVRRRR